jgi:hypothetical protein
MTAARHTHRFERSLETPAGAFRTSFECDCDCVDAPRGAAQQVEDTIGRVDKAGLSVQLLMSPIEPRLPSGTVVDGCIAMMWTVTARLRLQRLRFHFVGNHGVAAAARGGAPGEGLAAFIWQIGDLAISVGTEDGEFLKARAEHADGMARHLRDEFHMGTVQCWQNGLYVPLSAVEAGERIEIHFIVAWAHDSAESGHTSTWFAVDQSHQVVRDLLRGDTDWD